MFEIIKTGMIIGFLFTEGMHIPKTSLPKLDLHGKAQIHPPPTNKIPSVIAVRVCRAFTQMDQERFYFKA